MIKLQLILIIFIMFVFVSLTIFYKNTLKKIKELHKNINDNLDLQDSNILEVLENANYNYDTLEKKNMKLRKKQKQICNSIKVELDKLLPLSYHPIDCIEGEWSNWNNCSTVTCNKDGIKTRTREIKTEAQHEGKECGELIETQPCKGYCPSK